MTERILVCDDEASLREMLAILLKRHGYEVDQASGVRDAFTQLGKEDAYDVVITDLNMPDGSGMDVLDKARERDVNTQVVMVTAFGSTELAVDAMRRGAYDYIQKPFKNTELLATLEKALEKRAIVDENRELRARVRAGLAGGGDLIGESPAMRQLMSLVHRAASSTSSVLITGESGTGKEMVARALHFQGPRGDKPFVVVNCGALPETLMESELFGHEKGAFTGANRKNEGLVRSAEGGTLFLDEVGELPASLQVKLLRVLQERRVRPVGGSNEVSVNVRVVAATNRDVEREVTEGTFREDLFYRLNVIRLNLPPLRDRPEDIAPLALHFLEKHNVLQGRRLALSDDATAWLKTQTFPGNVRELENTIERAVALADGPLVEPSDLTERPLAAAGCEPSAPTDLPLDGFSLDDYLAAVERRVLYQALEQSNGVRTNAAKLLGMSFRSFRYRLAKYEGDS